MQVRQLVAIPIIALLLPASYDRWRIAQVQNASSTFAYADHWHPTDGIVSPYGSKTYKGRLDWDADEDGVIDSNFEIWTDPTHQGMQKNYGEPDEIYNGVAARHPNRTANLTFLDGHAATLQITDIMALPEKNNDIWGRRLFSNRKIR